MGNLDIVLCLVIQLCQTLCDCMDCSCRPDSSAHGDFSGKNTGVGCHALLQGLFPTQGIESRSSALQANSLPSEPPAKSNLNITWLIIGYDRMHPQHHLFFSFPFKLNLNLFRFLNLTMTLLGLRFREIFIKLFFFISPLRRCVEHFFPNCSTCKILTLSTYCTFAFVPWLLRLLPCGHTSAHWECLS